MSTTVVNTNVMALNSHRALNKVGNTQSKASARLSSGLKVNSGADDAAGLAISEKMRAQIRGLDMASKNSQDAISMIQTADGGLSEIDNMVQRIRELTVQAANETNQTGAETTSGNAANADTGKLATEAAYLIQEIDAMARRSQFNKIDLNVTNGTGTSNGDPGRSRTMQVGSNANQMLTIDFAQIDSTTLGLVSNTVSDTIVSGGVVASDFLSVIDNALEKVVIERAQLGSAQNRLEYTINSLDISSENTSSAESRIRDADMAKEMMNVSKANVLQQAATSMLAQANQAPQNILQLLQ